MSQKNSALAALVISVSGLLFIRQANASDLTRFGRARSSVSCSMQTVSDPDRNHAVYLMRVPGTPSLTYKVQTLDYLGRVADEVAASVEGAAPLLLLVERGSERSELLETYCGNGYVGRRAFPLLMFNAIDPNQSSCFVCADTAY